MPNDHDLTLPATMEACAPCGLHRPERVAYYDGKMLTARDLTAEQSYFNGMRHLGNMLLEGEGTVCGLKVLEHPQEGCQSSYMVLARGMALTCCGQEIVVPADVTIPFHDMIAEDPALQDALVEGGMDLLVKLCRKDTPSEMAPVLISDCCADGDGQLPSRIAEDYGFTLEAAVPGSLEAERQIIKPELKWVHSINTEDETPLTVAVDEDAGLVYVGSDAGGTAYVRAYDIETHAHVLTLQGFDRIFDIAVPSAGPWMFVAGERGGQAIIALYGKTPAHRSDPEKTLEIEGLAQLAVSERTGSLFCLSLRNGDEPVLQAWASEALLEATPTLSTQIENGGTIRTDAMRAGCRMIEVDPEGRMLALLLPDIHRSPLHLAATHDLINGRVTDFNEMEELVRSETGADLTDDYQGASSLQFSYDSKLLHIVGRVAGEDDGAFYYRVNVSGAAETQSGRGGQFAISAGDNIWPDLSVAPDERWVYVTGAVPVGERAGQDGRVEVLPTTEAKQPGDAPALITPIKTILLDAQLTAGTMRRRGDRLFVPGFDLAGGRPEEDEVSVVRGRVMVVDISEADIKGMFEEAVEGCRTCGDTCSCVTLAHVTGYVWNEEEPMRIRDSGMTGGEGAEIDNLSYRPLVPSNTTLMEAILEIAARGVETGPPGARGEDGPAGASGLTITQVEYRDDVEDPSVEPINATSQRLVLPEPEGGAAGTTGDDGEDGDDGLSIVEVREVRNSDTKTPPFLETASDGRNWRLVLPEPVTGDGGSDGWTPPAPEEYHFVEGQSAPAGTNVDLNDFSSFTKFELSLSDPVTNPDVLFAGSGVGQLYFSGVFEIRVHTFSDLDRTDNDPEPTLFKARTFQYAPLFDEIEEVFFDGFMISVPMTDLWQSLANYTRDGKRVYRRGRVEFILHGTFLENARKVPFDGRHEPAGGSVEPRETGGTWRTWLTFTG